MKATVYLRMAQTSRGFRYAATSKPSSTPLFDPHGEALPTIAFALSLTLPPGIFNVPVVAEVVVPDSAIRPVVDAEVVK